MSLSKKIFIASSILLAFFLIFWGVYNLAFKKPAVQSPSDSFTPKNAAVAPSTAPQTILPVSDEAVLAPVLTPDRSAIKYYSQATGQVYQIDLDGHNKKTINTKELKGLVSVAWSPDTSKVISQIFSGGKPRFYYYNYASGKGFQLKDNLDTVVWQNDSKILYKYFDPKTRLRSLNLADPDGSNWQKITDLSARFVSLAPVPKTSLVSFWNSPDAFTGSWLQTIPTIGGETKTLFQQQFGGDFLWNQDGSLVLISSSPEKGGAKLQLAIANDRGGEYKNLDVPTLISKCVWSKDNKTVYYALPGNLPPNAVLPNEYREKKFMTADTFWKVNTVTGEKSRVIDLNKISANYDAINLFLNSDESLLFFTNRLDGKLYRVSL